jgi:hypothetical protein
MSSEGKNMKWGREKRGKCRGQHFDPKKIFIPPSPPQKKNLIFFLPLATRCFMTSIVPFLP